MKEKIIIFGGGPCGMRLAENFIDRGEEVHLYESSDSLGGCWKINWEDGYFKEHSPRVMTSTYKRVIELVNGLGLKDPYNDIYGSSFNSTMMFAKYFLKNLSFSDSFKFFTSKFFISKNDERNVKEWMDDNNITTNGRKAIKDLSIALANVPERVSIYTFFESLTLRGCTFIQFREGGLWLKKWEERLRDKGVKIHFNGKLNSFHEKNGKVDYAITSKGKVSGDKFLLAIPLWNLKEIMKNCESDKLKNNWMKSDEFTEFCENSSYTGLGVQLHFNKNTNIDLEKNWCQTCSGDWSIIAQKTSHYLEKFSKVEGVKEVWSCVIVDFTRKSKRLGATPMKLKKEEIGEEVVYQLSQALGEKIKPSKITYNLKEKRGGKWDFLESAYSANKDGWLNPKGSKIKNIFTIGCHNLWEIAILEGALKAADRFLEMKN